MEDSQMVLIRQLIKHDLNLHFHAVFSIIATKQWGKLKPFWKPRWYLVLVYYQNVAACDYIYILYMLETGNILIISLGDDIFFGSTRETKHNMDF